MPTQGRGILATCAFGLAAGGIAVLFNLAIKVFYHLTFDRLFLLPAGWFLLGSGALLLGTTAIAGWLLTVFAPDAAGSGIPQVKLAFWRDFGFISPRILWVKFIAGVLSVGGGSSLGREGPSVQLAGALSTNLAGLFGSPKQQRRLAAACGAAGGLAAAFNTPLAAFAFVLEEIIGDMNSRLLGNIILASVLGASVVHIFIGRNPAFQLIHGAAPAWEILTFAPFIAAAVSFLGVLFQKSVLAIRARCRRAKSGPRWLQPAIGGAITWALGSAVFLTIGRQGVFSLGYGDLTAALSDQMIWRDALIILVAKFIATVSCYGTGGCGGIFAPTLCLGAMCGVIVSGLAHTILPITADDRTALALIGMSAFLGAVVRAPVTSILIVFEMTQDFVLIPALMVAALVSQAISRAFLEHGFYDALLEQDGVHLEHTVPPRDLRGWLERPVAAVANTKPIAVTDLDRASLRQLLDQHPFERFPLLRDGLPAGVLTRQEISQALRENRAPVAQPAPTCSLATPVRDVQSLLVSSTSNLVLLVDSGRLAGLITLHDLLRAQANNTGDY